MIKIKYLIGKKLRSWIENFPDALILYSGDLHEIERNIESQLRFLVSFPRVSIVRFEEEKYKIYISYQAYGLQGNWESREIEGPNLSELALLDRDEETRRTEKILKSIDLMAQHGMDMLMGKLI